MSDRDTHFQGFARLVARELYENGLLDLNHAAVYDAPGMVVEIIAQRAYDLANHIIRHTDDTQMRWDEITESPMEYVSRGTNIPDLTQWPKDE